MAINAKQYLLSFMATLHGDKAVMAGLKGMETAIQKQRKEMGLAGKQTKNFAENMTFLAKRALMVMPIWFALRAVFMSVIRAIGDMIRANLDLEDGMARIRTLLSGTVEEIRADMIVMKRAILDSAVTASMSLKDLAEAMYFLRTASLTTEEAMSAFPHVIDAVLGSGANLKTMVRAIAGAYNTMGKFMDKNLTTSEKFQQISDALTFTFTTQEVEMNELVAGYMKLAPFVSGLDDDFTTLVTILGVLNTKQLKGSRTGRLLGRSIIQISKNAEKLAQVFNITFDPNKPVTLLKVMKAIGTAMKEGTRLTQQQSKALQDIFATRGQVPFALIAKDIDTLTEAVDRAHAEMKGYSKTMREIRELTTTKQFKRMGNIIQVLTNDFIAGALAAGDMARALSDINDGLIKLRKPLQFTGDLLGWMNSMIKEFDRVGTSAFNLSQFGLMDVKNLKANLSNLIPTVDLLGEYIQKKKEIRTLAEKENKGREAEAAGEKLDAEVGLKNIKLEIENEKQIIKLLKIRGASEGDIAKFKLDHLLANRLSHDALKFEIELEKARNDVLATQEKRRKSILDLIQSANRDLLKARGAGEFELGRLKERQLDANRSLIGDSEYMLQLIRLRVDQAVKFQKLKEKELQTATNIYLQYAKADEVERSQIERMMELIKMGPGALSRAIKNPFDFAVIDKFWDYFTQKQQEAMGEGLRRQEGLDRFQSADMWDEKTRAMEEYQKKYWDWVRRGAPAGEKPNEPLTTQNLEAKALDFEAILGDITKNMFDEWLNQGTLALEALDEESARRARKAKLIKDQGLLESAEGDLINPEFEDNAERLKNAGFEQLDSGKWVKQETTVHKNVTVNFDIEMPPADTKESPEESGDKLKNQIKDIIPELKKAIDDALQEI